MQSDGCPPGVLQPVYDRIHLESLGSFDFYRKAAESIGFEPPEQIDLTANLRRHNARDEDELRQHYDDLVHRSSQSYLDRLLIGPYNRVQAHDTGSTAKTEITDGGK